MKYAVIILGIFFGDNWLKRYVDKNEAFLTKRNICGQRITLTRHHNKGAVLNFMEQRTKWVTAFSSVAISAAFAFFLECFETNKNKAMKLGSAILLGGGLSNLFDRIKQGYVVDYFIINKGKLKKVIFNLSDLFIFAGSILILVGAMSQKEKQ